MKTTFQLTTHHTLQSAIVDDDATNALQVGDRLHLECGFSTPWGDIPAGIACDVTTVSEDDGMVELYVPQYVAALEPWGKCIILMPFLTDDILHLFRLVTKHALPLLAAA